jgi:carbonic anhydrase
VEKLLSNLKTNAIYNYPGSLTVPPCTENINWMVIDDPQPISAAQLEHINNYWKNNRTFANGQGNNRQAQPFGDRKVFSKAKPSWAGSTESIYAEVLQSIVGDI